MRTLNVREVKGMPTRNYATVWERRMNCQVL